MNGARREVSEYQREIQELRAQLNAQQSNGPPRQPGLFDQHATSQTNGTSQQAGFPTYASGSSLGAEQARTLPPLVNGSVAPMQGIQYTEERR